MTDATIISNEWLTPAETMQELGISIRTLQEWAKGGHINFRRNFKGSSRERLYALADVMRLKKSGERPKRPPRKKAHDTVETQRKPDLTRSERQDSRALDTVSIVGQIMSAHKSEVATVVTQIENVAEKLFALRSDDQRLAHERAKWDREDARDRWEAEQKRFEAEQKRVEADLVQREEQARPWLTVREAMRSGLTARTLRELAGNGQLASIGSGRDLRIQRSSLEAFAG